MEEIDIHADDYGLSVNTSRSILSCIHADRLNSISVLPNMSCFDECLKLWEKELPEQKKRPAVSIHLNFVEGHCLCAPEKLNLLVDSDGYFKTSWVSLFWSCFSLHRKQIKAQLKLEIKAQIEKIRSTYLEDDRLRIDSHQHTHMIPVVFDALHEVIAENHYKIKYIRNSRDFLFPYLRQVSLWPTYRPINLVKVLILNILSFRMERKLKKFGINRMYLWGILMSGKMDRPRIKKLFPSISKIAANHKRTLEILFHPGTLLADEDGKDFVNRDAVAFYTSKNRKIEFETLMTSCLY